MDCYLCEAHNQAAPLCAECLDGIEGTLKDVRNLMEKIKVQTLQLNDAREAAFIAENDLFDARRLLGHERQAAKKRAEAVREACARYVEETVGLPDVADELRHHVDVEAYL